jgi:hypothetical protein
MGLQPQQMINIPLVFRPTNSWLCDTIQRNAVQVWMCVHMWTRRTTAYSKRDKTRRGRQRGQEGHCRPSKTTTQERLKKTKGKEERDSKTTHQHEGHTDKERGQTHTHTHTHTHTLLASKHDNIRDVRWPCIECAAQWGPTLRPPWAMRGPSLPRAHYGSKLGPPMGYGRPKLPKGPLWAQNCSLSQWTMMCPSLPTAH